jgi:hypothetical protein
MVQATKRSRRQRIEAAIAHALERRWDLAVEENEVLLGLQPDDIEAANRLGKAFTELGDVPAAITAYRRSLEIDPANVIARKNIIRLEAEAPAARKSAKDARAKKAPAPSGDAIRTNALIEESGKSAVLELHKPNNRALKRLSAGDPVQLEPAEDHGVNVKSSTRALLGHLEPRAGQRLRRLIEGGNRYEAAIRHIGDGTVTVIVRETYRDPSLLDEASFLPAAPERRKSAPRAYTRSSMVQREVAPPVSTDDDEDGDGDDAWPTAAAASNADELEEAGFGEERSDDDDDATANAGDANDDEDDDDEPDDDTRAELSSEFGDDAKQDEDDGDEDDLDDA